MQSLEFKDVSAHLELIGPRVDPEKTTVFSIFRDEMYFAPAFLDHYRGIGVSQFIVVDDGSTDGTTEYLDAQPDCIRIRSDLRYGDEIEFRDPLGKRKKTRAGIYFKGAIPLHLMPGRFVTYVDADEFMLLPPGIDSLDRIEARLTGEGDVAAFATLVEFFPRDASGFGALDAPQGLPDLLAASPYFDAEPLLKLVPGERRPEFIAQSKSVRLMEDYGLLPKVEAPRRAWRRLFRRKPPETETFFQSPRHKTPIVCHSERTFMVGTHNVNRPPSMTVMPAIAHFVFTPQFGHKVAKALEWGSHAHGASKYRYYAQLLELMQARESGFLGPKSQRYEGPEQLLDCGLMRW